MRTPLPAVAVAVSFISCINRTDIDGLAALMTDDHALQIFDEPPLTGRRANIEAWRGYFASFPEYVIYPHCLAERRGRVAILGHTTGSHLGLPDDEESRSTLLWVAAVVDGVVRSWSLVHDTSATRQEYGLGTPEPRIS
jgi:ketosteroid isomerase-like protein